MGWFKRKKEEKNQKKFQQSVERFEAMNFKKCPHCNENVPKDDNICMSCNQVP